MRFMILLAAAVSLWGCTSPRYDLVPAQRTMVAYAIQVKPSVSWNRIRRTDHDLIWEETWTQNGPLLDALRFICALPDGQAIARQSFYADRKMAVFRTDMTPPDLASVVESYYRIRAGAAIFEMISIKPASFLGVSAVEFNYSFIRADDVKRLGRALAAVIDDRLYFMSLDAVALHYFEAALPEFERIVTSASIL